MKFEENIYVSAEAFSGKKKTKDIFFGIFLGTKDILNGEAEKCQRGVSWGVYTSFIQDVR